MVLQQFVAIHLLQFLEYVMIDKSSLDLFFKSGLYEGMLDKKVKKNNKQFGNRFVKKTKKILKSGKQLSLTNKQLHSINWMFEK